MAPVARRRSSEAVDGQHQKHHDGAELRDRAEDDPGDRQADSGLCTVGLHHLGTPEHAQDDRSDADESAEDAAHADQ